jgi:hypothetical protein
MLSMIDFSRVGYNSKTGGFEVSVLLLVATAYSVLSAPVPASPHAPLDPPAGTAL